MKDVKYAIWLSRVFRECSALYVILLEHFGSSQSVYEAGESEYKSIQLLKPEQITKLLNKDLFEAEQIIADCQKLFITVVSLEDKANYPHLLRNIAAPPMVLYIKGRSDGLKRFNSRLALSIVGTRSATDYGLAVAHNISYILSCANLVIVSGIAEGNDAAAVEGSLHGSGFCASVLGGGIDVIYPRCNEHLFKRLGEDGLLISEYPPKTETKGSHYPVRNRIISGLTSGVIVAEAPERSGALITARHAIEQGRDVFAIPGHITAYESRGVNNLLKDGAISVTNIMDILQEYLPLYSDKINAENIPCLDIIPCDDTRYSKQFAHADYLGILRKPLPDIKPRTRSDTAKEKPSKPVAKAASVKSTYSSNSERDNAIDNDIDTIPFKFVKNTDALSADERIVYSVLSDFPIDIDKICELSKLPVSTVSPALLMMEINGYVKPVAGSMYIKIQ